MPDQWSTDATEEETSVPEVLDPAAPATDAEEASASAQEPEAEVAEDPVDEVAEDPVSEVAEEPEAEEASPAVEAADEHRGRDR